MDSETLQRWTADNSDGGFMELQEENVGTHWRLSFYDEDNEQIGKDVYLDSDDLDALKSLLTAAKSSAEPYGLD